MILSDIGNEFETSFKGLITEWKEFIFIFGAGILGKQLKEELSTYSIQVKFIDNDENKIGTIYENVEVISLKEYLSCNLSDMIVIAASQKNIPEIKRQLEYHGLVHETNYFFYEEFKNKVFPIISAYYYDKSYVSLVQISLTERCTLKCKKCAHACYAVNHSSQDMTLDDAYKSADSFFSKVDFVGEFVLIGGEPLLYKELEKVIQYIGENYRSQIGIFSITTNGTIVPSDVVMKMCAKYKVMFRISNYQKVIPKLKIAYDKLTSELSKNELTYRLGEVETQWTDYGFDYIDRKASEEELIKVFDKCQTSCREIRGNRYYFCVMARSVSENLCLNVGETDYLDLSSLQGDDYKKDLLKFNLGYLKKGYLDMCNFCHGAERINYPIPAAEQTE